MLCIVLKNVFVLCHHLRSQCNAGFRGTYRFDHDLAQRRKRRCYVIAAVVLGLVQFVQSSHDFRHALGLDLTLQLQTMDIDEQTPD